MVTEVAKSIKIESLSVNKLTEFVKISSAVFMVMHNLDTYLWSCKTSASLGLSPEKQKLGLKV